VWLSLAHSNHWSILADFWVEMQKRVIEFMSLIQDAVPFSQTRLLAMYPTSSARAGKKVPQLSNA
jgi:hypothetical protein